MSYRSLIRKYPTHLFLSVSAISSRYQAVLSFRVSFPRSQLSFISARQRQRLRRNEKTEDFGEGGCELRWAIFQPSIESGCLLFPSSSKRQRTSSWTTTQSLVYDCGWAVRFGTRVFFALRSVHVHMAQWASTHFIYRCPKHQFLHMTMRFPTTWWVRVVLEWHGLQQRGLMQCG